MMLNHLDKSQESKSENSSQRLIFRNNKLVPESSIQKINEPKYLFEAIEMDTTANSAETTFILEQRDSSPDVTFIDDNVIELSSDDEKIKPNRRKAIHTSHRVYEQWPEEIQKSLEKQRKQKEKTCKKCHFTASNSNKLLKHIDSSTINCLEAYKPKVKCYICNKMFMMMKSKTAHVKRDHVNCVQKECHICEQSLRETPQTYENHLRKHFESPTNLCVSFFIVLVI